MNEEKLRELAGILNEAPSGSLAKFIVVRNEVRRDFFDVLEGPESLMWESTMEDFRLQVVGAITATNARTFLQEEWTIYPPNAKNAALKDATKRFQKTQRGR